MSKLENAIFISGAGQRIGAYLVRQLLKQNKYPVIFSYRTHHPEVDELIELGAVAIQSDFTAENAMQDLVAQIKERTISLRAIIHNASLWLSDEQAPVGTPQYQSLFTLHVDAPLYLSEHLFPLLQQSESALKDIVAISDFRVAKGDENKAAYLASKAALQSLTKSLAKRYAPAIKVNDIAPSLIIFNKGDSHAYQQARLSEGLLPIEPGEAVVWDALQYLMNSSYSTGLSLPVNGGRHIA